ncbi:hypothetical protein D0Z86_25105, partial [Salmonella enterica subsp. enterica serovar Newport]|nr:hypothetical protein [Salmonella enterica subsp. enterica serovar Newport]
MVIRFAIPQLKMVILLILLLGNTKTFSAGGDLIKERANAVLSLMTYTVVPDITASDLNIRNTSNERTALSLTQIGGGATL